jgi:hypothetical protein
LSENANDVLIQVLKIYDRAYASEVLHGMSSEAQHNLAVALQIEQNYEAEDVPDPDGLDYEEFLWRELLDAAREDVRLDPNLFSFFVVTESIGGRTQDLFVSPDWPSAEEFAKKRLDDLTGGKTS